MKKRFIKGIVVVLCMSLVFGLCPFIPTVSAKAVFKTLAFDGKLETKQDFIKGKFRNLEIKEKDGKIEMSLLTDKNGEYISPAVKAPFKATHIGLHWEEELIDESSITVYLRTSNDGENFGEWTKTTAERDMGKDGVDEEETFATLVGIKKADFAQAKIEFIPGKGVSPKLKVLTFTFLNSEKESETTKKLSFVSRSAAEGIGVEKTSPNGQSINVISREDWGAEEEYRMAEDGSEEWPRSYHGTRKLVVHHTADASSNGETDLETNKETVRNIYYYHAVTRGWGDIGYNALVDAAGNIYEGRYGTHDAETRENPIADDIMTLDVEAGHTSSYNSGSFGISALGDFTAFEVPTAQLTAIKEALAFVADSRGIYADGNSDFLRYDGAWHYDLRNVFTHKDAGQTACPGDKLYLEMTGIRAYIDNLKLLDLENFSATADSISTESGNTSGDNIGSSTTVTIKWSPFLDATEYQYVLEKVVGVAGVASTSEPWEVAWFSPENLNMTTDTSVSFTSNDFDDESNYVFYVRALNENETPISSVSHINFVKDENNVIIDNLSDRYTSFVGDWSASTNVSSFYAQDYQPNDTGRGSDTFEWTPNLFKGGDYDVSVWYAAAGDRSNKVPYTVFYQDANDENHEQTILINQKRNGGMWVSLGTFYFTTEGDAKVQLSDNTRRGYVIADAVKFTLK